MTMQVDIKKVFRFDRELKKLLGELEIFKNFIEEIDKNDLSKNDKLELIELAKELWGLLDDINDKTIEEKIKEIFRLIAFKVEEENNEEDKILALRGDIGYLNYLEEKEKGNLTILSSKEDIDKFLDEL